MDKKNNVEVVFEELKEKRLIDKNIKLVPNKKTPGFQYKGNYIAYNPENANISKESLRFILLHEMGHKNKNQYKLTIIAIAVFLLIIVRFLINPELFSINSTIFWIAWLSLLSLVFFMSRENEFKADKWAAEKYFRTYNKSPSKTMKKALEECKGRSGILTIILHPTDEKRIQAIQKLELEKKL